MGHLDGLVAAGGDVGDGLAALEARVRVKVLALRGARMRSATTSSAN